MTAVPSQKLRAKLFNTQHFTKLTEEHCSQPCRISTRHGNHTNFPRETIPARKREIHRYRYIYIRNDQLSEQVLCTQCTHISEELPPTEYGNFQHEGTSIPNVIGETTLQMDTSKKEPGASLIQKGKDIPVTDTSITYTLSHATPMNQRMTSSYPSEKPT